MGLLDWTKKQGKSGLDYTKKMVGTEDIKQNAKYIQKMAQSLDPRNIGKNSKKETFLEAKSRLNISEIDIIKNYKNQVYSLYISCLFSVLCFIYILYNLFVLKSILGAFSCLAVLLICLANSFRFSFRAFQIKHQKLCSAKEWWDRSSEWFPKIP
jgi:hypothetical protein